MAKKSGLQSLKQERREYHDRVINFFNEQGEAPFNYKQVSAAVGANTPKRRMLIVEILDQLAVDGFLVQVGPILGAGIPHSWRRWVFWWGTCAAKRAPTHYSGAGPHPFSSPAPTYPYTCANIPLYLRQDPPGPAPKSQKAHAPAPRSEKRVR